MLSSSRCSSLYSSQYLCIYKHTTHCICNIFYELYVCEYFFYLFLFLFFFFWMALSVHIFTYWTCCTNRPDVSLKQNEKVKYLLLGSFALAHTHTRIDARTHTNRQPQIDRHVHRYIQIILVSANRTYLYTYCRHRRHYVFIVFNQFSCYIIPHLFRIFIYNLNCPLQLPRTNPFLYRRLYLLDTTGTKSMRWK